MAMDASSIRKTFVDFFAARGHTVVPSSSLIPVDPTLLLTSAGMVQFKPYMAGDEAAPYPRAVSVQKCARTTDIDIVGTTARHLTFFEMLGNFSLGDYFKAEAIPWAWELVTDGFGFDPGLLWITVHVSDDEAARIWTDVVGVPPERIQRFDADNWWSMGVAGPCGPCSEIFFDRGPAFGVEGGPAADEERFVEIWNLVFMQYLRDGAGKVVGDLPRKCIDTGSGLERVAAALSRSESVFETDTIRPILAVAEAASGRAYGSDPATDVSLRILADHGRAVTFLVTDGVFPSNEERGYVLRRVLRRAVRHAWLLGIDDPVMARLSEATVEILGGTYPELVAGADTTTEIVANEEARFRETLRAGLHHLDDAFAVLPEGAKLPGAAAFKLHDTFGFPVELTSEVAAERGVALDSEGFDAEMGAQRDRARRARREESEATPVETYRDVLASTGTSDFLGYETTAATGRVVGLVRARVSVEEAGPDDDVEVFADRTPFYAEAGGQVGDTGEIRLPGATLEVVDTRYALPGLVAHRARVRDGRVHVGDTGEFLVDAARRAGIRRSHTATHILHWALRDVLGDHVRQHGSLVEDGRLRFDFSHFAAVTPEELARVQALANAEMLTNAAVVTTETSKAEADALGAVAFFGDKYGERVRVVQAGERSTELCGGTHVHALGEIGPVVITSESSIGSNLRRIEALTGGAAIGWYEARDRALREAADLLRTSPEDVTDALGKRLAQWKQLEAEVAQLRARAAGARAESLAAAAFPLAGGARGLVQRVDGLASPKDLQRLAVETRQHLDGGAVVLGAEIGGKASLVAAVGKALQGQGLSAADAVREAAAAVGGGTGRNADVAMAGGPRGEALEDALASARAFLASWEPGG